MAHGDTSATRAEAIARLKEEGRGGRWQTLYANDCLVPVVRSLTHSQYRVYAHMRVRCPPYGLRIGIEQLAAELSMNERTLRRNLAVLYELRLMSVEGTGGGAYQDVNKYFAHRPDPNAPPRRGSRLWKKYNNDGPNVGPSPVPVVASHAPTPGEPMETADVVESSAEAPAAVLPEDCWLPEFTDDERLVVLARFPLQDLGDLGPYLRPGAAQPADRRKELWDWAEAAGVGRPQPREAPPPADARGMVDAFLNQWHLRRAPLRVELTLAAGLIRNHGSATAWNLLSAANARLVDMRRRGNGQDPMTMRYLEIHLRKLGARWAVDVRAPDG